jgi:MATE family multidrug resistance protein
VCLSTQCDGWGLGAVKLAAVSLSNNFIFIAMFFGIRFSNPITPLVTEANTEKNLLMATF